MTDAEAILDLERRRGAAIIAQDAAALDELLHPEFAYVHTNGWIETRAEWLANLGVMADFLAVERSDLTVRLYGDTAILVGGLRNTLRRKSSGELLLMVGVATLVAVRAQGRWQFVAYQATLTEPMSTIQA